MMNNKNNGGMDDSYCPPEWEGSSGDIDQPPREYTNGPRPRGADGEWIEGLVEQDLDDHDSDIVAIMSGRPCMRKNRIIIRMVDRFEKTFTFGESE